MKRIFALLLTLVLFCGLVACSGNQTPSTDSATSGGTDGSSDTDLATDSSTSSGTSTEDVKEEPRGYQEDLEHKFLATDIQEHSIVVFDLNLCDGVFNNLTADKCVIWEWDSDNDPNCKIKPGVGIDSAKYRYSDYYGKDVIIACSSGGWAGVIDYEEQTVLWEYSIGSGPHSIEMMPNGDVVVAGSSGADTGILAYVPLSQGKVTPSFRVNLPSGHGVMYDPQQDLLWVLEYEQICAWKVTGYGTADAKLSKVNGMGADFGGKDASGHALTPKLGDPGKYWVSAGRKVWLFDSTEEEMTSSFDYSSSYSAGNVKGMVWFEDETMIQIAGNRGENCSYEWSSHVLRIITLELSKGKVQNLKPVITDVYFADREFYKIQPFTKDYQ